MAITFKACSVDGCKANAHYTAHGHKGFCAAHYQRLYKYGDPLGGGTAWGAVRKWLDETALSYEASECLLFPYSRDRHGYGRVNLSRKYVGAHIYVAERCLGAKPSPTHEVLHTCNNGAGGCVSPKHLRWGTRKENVADAIAAGTFSPPPIGLRGQAFKRR